MPWGYARSVSGSPGVAVLLTTTGNEREDWLAAGQGLQRALPAGPRSR
ncbi:hypothetical protein [Planomonospora parontospora]|nr:hypothetical protein [Planomonospora parontospora]